MPLRKSIPSLQNLSFQTIESLITTIGNNILQNDEISTCNFTQLTETLQILLYDETARCFHNKIANHCLQALENLYQRYNAQNSAELLEKCETAVKHLAMLVPQPTLKSLQLRKLSLPIQSILIANFDKMTGLESINAPPNPARCYLFEQKILSNPQTLSNLTLFNMPWNCNDRILAVISEHCKSIQSIFVVESQSVTDHAIDSLVNCVELQHVEMAQTALSQRGYFKLLTETQSKNLINVGICIYLTSVLDLMEAYVEPLRTYQIQRLQCLDVNTEHLFLICKYFPQLTELIMNHDSVVPDLFCLSRLQNLRKVSLSVCDFYADRLSDFLTARGSFITSLCLDVVRELQISCIVHIGVSCPNIERLQFFECEFFEDSVLPRIEHNIEPFQKLKFFSCVSNISLAHVEFVLRYAYNIEELEIRPAQVITDEFFYTIFSFNPLKQLRTLKIDYINAVSVDMLKLIIKKCEKISCMANFSSSIAISKDELKSAQDFITANNYDLTLN